MSEETLAAVRALLAEMQRAAENFKPLNADKAEITAYWAERLQQILDDPPRS